MKFYVITRNKPTTEEITRPIFERTEDAHRENKDAATRYVVAMIATICGCGDVTIRPIPPHLTGLIEVVDLIAADQQTEPFEYEGHVWQRVGPLNEEDMDFLMSSALDFVLNHLDCITVEDLGPEADQSVGRRKDTDSVH